jgi:hypothetical protein
MTNREFYTKIASLTNVDSELVEFATDAIAKMDAQADARKVKAAEKAAEKRAEKDPIRNALFDVMSDAETPKTASMLIADAGLEDTVKPASVPSLMRPLVEAGLVGKVDVKITGKGTQRGYVKL